MCRIDFGWRLQGNLLAFSSRSSYTQLAHPPRYRHTFAKNTCWTLGAYDRYVYWAETDEKPSLPRFLGACPWETEWVQLFGWSINCRLPQTLLIPVVPYLVCFTLRISRTHASATGFIRSNVDSSCIASCTTFSEFLRPVYFRSLLILALLLLYILKLESL